MVGGARPSRHRHRNTDSLHIQRERANKRERERTKLRQKIPSLPSDKTSKIHTLRVTIEYIHFLYEMVYNQNNILNRMDLTLNDDNQINLPATFNSWRTSLNQKWHMNMLKQQQVQKRNQQLQQEQMQLQQLTGPSTSTECLSKDIYCPSGFANFVGQSCADITTKLDMFESMKGGCGQGKRIKTENAEYLYGLTTSGNYVSNYGADTNLSASLSCALGQVITQSQL